MVTVKYEDLALAFDFVSFASAMTHEAYVSLDTGAIYWISEDNPSDEEIPEDLETSDRYVAIPHKNELDLGQGLALRFAAEQMPNESERIRDFFQRRGAYARFKDFLAAEGRLEDWYSYERDATEKALKQWSDANGIHLVK